MNGSTSAENQSKPQTLTADNKINRTTQNAQPGFFTPTNYTAKPINIQTNSAYESKDLSERGNQESQETSNQLSEKSSAQLEESESEDRYEVGNDDDGISGNEETTATKSSNPQVVAASPLAKSEIISIELLVDGVQIYKLIKTKSKPKKAKIATINNQNRTNIESKEAIKLLSDADIQNVEFHLDSVLSREKHNRLTNLISGAGRAIDEIVELLAESATEKHLESLNRLQTKLDTHLKANATAGEQSPKRKRAV